MCEEDPAPRVRADERLSLTKRKDRKPRRLGPPGFGILTVGSLVSGVSAFLVIALGTRGVGEVGFAPVSILWSLWALSAAAITFPLQHWIIRTAELLGEGSLRVGFARILPIVSLLSISVMAGSLILGEHLYSTSPVAFAVMTGLLPLGGVVMGIQRGLLAHRGRFSAVAVTFAGENLIRAVGAAAVLALSPSPGTGAVVLGWSMISGFGIAVVFGSALWPRGEADPTAPVISLRLLSGIAGANISAQTTLTSGPVLLSLLAAPEAIVTQTFAVLALIRVPYTGLTGATAAISGPLTRLARDAPARLRSFELWGAVILVAVALFGAAIAPSLLPPMTSALFATTMTISDAELSMLLAGGIVAIGSLLEMLVLLAVGRPRRLLVAWSGSLLFGLAFLIIPAPAITRVAAAFLAATTGAFVAMLARRAR